MTTFIGPSFWPKAANIGSTNTCLPRKTVIENDELLAFRLLAKSYAGLAGHQIDPLLTAGDFVEICYDDKTEIQK